MVVMRRTWWFRPFAALFAAWFPLVVGEPSLLQPCPTHGAAAAVTHAAPSAHAALAASVPHSQHVQHAEHSRSSPEAAHVEHHDAFNHGSTHHDSAPNHQHHNCTCIGCCAGSVGSVVLPSAPTATIDATVRIVATAQRSTETLPRPAPEFSRPYTTGPPRA